MAYSKDYVKKDGTIADRVVLNTTVERELYQEFQEYLKNVRIPMNVMIEAFIRQCIDDEFIVKIERKPKAKKPKSIELELKDSVVLDDRETLVEINKEEI